MAYRKISRKVIRARGIMLYSYNVKQQKHDHFPEGFVKNEVFSIASRSMRGHMTALATVLARLAAWSGAAEWYFMPELRIPWVLYKPTNPLGIRAVEFLARLKIGGRYDGAVSVPVGNLKEFCPHYFWMARHQWFDSVYFTDNQHFVGSVCQHGSIHLAFFTEAAVQQVTPILAEVGFHPVDSCHTPWTKTSRIVGRKMLL